jgi:hypothetical protein
VPEELIPQQVLVVRFRTGHVMPRRILERDEPNPERIDYGTGDLRTIGERLNVSTVLEGSVRKEGSRVRIVTQLVNARDEFHLWSQTYDRELTGVFAAHEEIFTATSRPSRVSRAR